MSCSPSARTIVCTEVFDENSLPSEEEIRDYAAKIGIDVASETHLLHLARDGLMQALPPGWKPCFDEELRAWYYFNFRTGESRWEHPLDDVYRSLVRKGRSESLSDEEDADDMKKQLAPLRKAPSPTTPGDAELRLDLRLDQQRRGADVPSPSTRIDIDKMGVASLLEARNRASLPQEKHPKNLHGGLALTGGGSVFLKSKQQQEDDHRKSVRFNIQDEASLPPQTTDADASDSSAYGRDTSSSSSQSEEKEEASAPAAERDGDQGGEIAEAASSVTSREEELPSSEAHPSSSSQEELARREAALKAEAEERHREALAALRRQLDAEAEDQRRLLQELRERNRKELEAVQEEQATNLQTLKEQFQMQEESLRRDHCSRVEELRRRLEADEDSHRGYEKLRCEKRLLEDKYRSLKEKYLRLYTDVKVSIEKRKRRDAGSAASGHSRKAAVDLDDGGGGGAEVDDAAEGATSPRAAAELNDNDAAAGDNNNPVENLRRQLRSLEDLEEQFPASPLTHADTYLRYPFADHSPASGAAELEFFRHRIHLERDSVRRAKDFLRVQRDSFQARRSELRQRERGSVLDQLYKEERELTDMEVSLHRTKSLLGEKIIRLRHLEQSLQRAGASGAATLSDVSSHSGSSGFSSSATAPEAAAPWRSLRAHYHEPTEIVHSLESLNSEIRDIWQVLHRRRKDGGVPPPPLLWPSQQLQDRSLVERTRSLRDWLRQARMDSPAAPANAASKAL